MKDLLKGNSSQFLSHAEFQTAFRINVNILEYLGIISALKELRKSFPQQLRDPNTTTQQVFGKVFLQTQKPGKLAYKKLIQRKSLQRQVKKNGLKTVTFPKINQFNGDVSLPVPLNTQNARSSSLFILNSCTGG